MNSEISIPFRGGSDNPRLQLQQHVISQLKLYVQPTVLSFGMKYLPFILHLVTIRISNVRLSLKADSVVFLLDSVDASFDVVYDQPPAVISPEVAIAPDTPAELWSPAPAPSFVLPSMDKEGSAFINGGQKTRVHAGHRGWESLWRKIMRRASGRAGVTVIISKCRLLKVASSGTETGLSTSSRLLNFFTCSFAQLHPATEIGTLAGKSTLKLSIAFGALENRGIRHRLKRLALPHVPRPSFSTYLAVNGVNFDGQLPPVDLNIREMEHLLDDIQARKNLHAAKPQDATFDPRAALKKATRNKELAQAIGRAMNKVNLSMPKVTLHHSIEASYLAPKVAAETLDPAESHDSGICASFGRGQNAVAESPGDISLALIIDGLNFQVQSVNQANSLAIRDIFGRPTEGDERRGELVRGLEFDLSLQNLSVQRFRNSKAEDISTIVSTGQINFTAVTTMFSAAIGWESFPSYIDEANNYLLQLEFSAQHFRLRASVDMVTQLILGMRAAAALRNLKIRPEHDSKASVKAGTQHGQIRQKVPKMIVVCRIGEVDIGLADTEANPSVHCCITNAGLHVAGHTEHQDVRARKLNKDSKLKPRFLLYNGYTSAINWDCGGEIATTKVTLSSSTTLVTGEPIEVVRIGKGFLKSSGSILGRARLLTNSIDFDLNSKIGSLIISFSNGIDVRLWKTESQQMLAALFSTLENCQSMLQRPRNDTRNVVVPDPLRSLPSGISIKLSLGTVTATLASRDPNPACQLKLLRGLRLQTALTLDYCYFAHEEQVLRSSRLLSTLQHRSKLHLTPGLETEAEALANKHAPSAGAAALFGIKCKEVLLVPVFNAHAFAASEAASERFPPVAEIIPTAKRTESIAIWDFQKKDEEPSTPAIVGPNNRDPFGMDYTQQIQRPILVIPDATMGINLVRQTQDTPIERQVVARVAYAELSGDLSHVYCVLLAIQALKNCRKSGSTTDQMSPEQPSRSRIKTTLRLRMDYLEIDALFPIGERMFGSFSELHLVHQPHCQAASLRSGMIFVPSAREDSKFEELGRFKNLSLTVTSGRPPAVTVDADAFRIRVPYKYEPARLFLNINSAIKASRLLFHAIHTSQFRAVLLPRVQAVKKVPAINIRCKSTSFEIKDDPLETKLNLLFRVGKTESAPRAERRAYFEAKAALIGNIVGPRDKTVRPVPQSELERIRERYNVTLDHTVPVPDARQRLFLYDSEKWVKKMRKARHTQSRREERELIRQYGYRTDYSGLPIEVVSPQRFAPLFRSSLNDVNVSIKDPNFDSAALLAHMESRAGPFPPDQQFSLRVPLEIQLTSNNADFTLRDYPLPLWRVMPLDDSVRNSDSKGPAMICNMTLVIAEEFVDDEESYFLIPCTVIPGGTGDSGAAALELEIAKTLAPVKSYADIKFKIQSSRPTDFAWGVSYGYAISDLARAFAGFSHPPRDPSPRLGFWDKFRQSFHWRVAFDFAAPCHLHLKGMELCLHFDIA